MKNNEHSMYIHVGVTDTYVRVLKHPFRKSNFNGHSILIFHDKNRALIIVWMSSVEKGNGTCNCNELCFHGILEVLININ